MSAETQATTKVEHQVLDNNADSAASGNPKSHGGTSSQPDKISSLMSVFIGDHKDIMLLGYYTALLKLYDGSNDENDPTICTTSEEIVDWVGYAVMTVIYIVRHFFLETKGKQRLLWAKFVRLFLFAVFALCLHSQPISCSLPRGEVSMNGTMTVEASASAHLHTLSFVQGALVLTLALVASETCRRQLMAPDSSDQADGGTHRGTEMRAVTSSQPV